MGIENAWSLGLRRQEWDDVAYLGTSLFPAVVAEGLLVGCNHEDFSYKIYNLADKKIHMSHGVRFIEDSSAFNESIVLPKTTVKQQLF